MTRKHVTVSLSGDAGDELFGGYTRYLFTSALWRRTGKLPGPARSSLASLLSAVSLSSWDTAYGTLSPLLPRRFRFAHFGHKIHKLAEILAARSADDIYDGLISHWKHPTSLVAGAQDSPTVMSSPINCPKVDSFEHRMMAADSLEDGQGGNGRRP